MFFARRGGPYPEHVALSEGGEQVISLWLGPNDNPSVLETTVEMIKKYMLKLSPVEVIVTVGKQP